MPKSSTKSSAIRSRKNAKAPRRSAEVHVSENVSFPIVGVGASAGGLEALSEFLKALPAHTGMAFVVIQHLAPQHKSALPQLLAKATPMPVGEASEGTTLQPNHVYVIPPNKTMLIEGAALRMLPRESATIPHHPVDEFFTALAREQKTASVGVILSGSGSDGVLGLMAIKEEGGVTFAQDPKTAAWSGMPSSAISAGAVDFVLPPPGIAGELARIALHSYRLNHQDAPTGDDPDGSDFENIYVLLRSATRIDFRMYKQPVIRRRVARRMALQKLASLKDYLRFLKQNPAETKALADGIFIHVTAFFRDPECFQALRKKVFPKLNLTHRSSPIRVWIPGCSTGEEAYTIAMLLIEALGPRAYQTRIQMFGTDISEQAVERARAGIFSKAVVRDVSAARLRRFFTKVEHGYQINKEVRSLCVFARHDLASDPPFSKLDLISCRNVLIYAGPHLQNRILSAFQYALNPGGFLFLGKSEAIGAYSDIFGADDSVHKIFSRRSKAGIVPYFAWRMDDHKQLDVAPPKVPLPSIPGDFQKQVEQALILRYAPPALVIDSDLHILHFQGDTSPYLVVSTGPPTNQLLKMLRPEFVVDLRGTLSKVKGGATTAATQPIHFEHGGHTIAVRLEVSALKKDAAKKPDFLVVFKEVSAGEPAVRKSRAATPENIKKLRLEQELAATRDYLKSLVAEHETAREEMQAANEEVLSSSEELQSTNEELETAKEELESSNEELTTLNEELLHRNLDLAILTNDLNNLLVGVDIPVVVLDGSLHIRRFTPVAGRIMKLTENDIGRPFSDATTALDVPDWDKLFAEVTSQMHSLEREVRAKDGRWHTLRIRPYRTSDNKIDGVILILLDTDMIKRELEESRDYAHMLLESAMQAIVATGAGGNIVLVNHATERMFGYRRDELLRRPLDVLLPAGIPPRQAGQSRTALRFGRDLGGRRKDGTKFPIEISLSDIDQAGVHLTVAFITDVTERQDREAQSESYRAEIRALAAQLITAQEEERRRVSRELHDSLCQKLATLAFDVENLAVALPSPAATRKRLHSLRTRAITVSEEARHIAYELHPSVLDDLGLVVSLKALCDDFSKTEKMRVQFKSGKLPDLISQKIASGIYRIAQASLQNVAKHAKAKRLFVALTVRKPAGVKSGPRLLELSVTDDGIGFAPEAVKGKGGLGLVGIRERARIMDGTVSIESKPRGGARIIVRVPLS